jgi:hypothetical protein
MATILDIVQVASQGWRDTVESMYLQFAARGIHHGKQRIEA